MESSTRIGRLVLALSLTEFGIEYLFNATGKIPAPGAPWPSLPMFWAFFAAIVLLLCPVTVATIQRPKVSSGFLGLLLFLYSAVQFGPLLLNNPHDPGAWTSAFEIFSIAGPLLALAGAAAGSNPLRRFGDCVFAFALVVFAVQHFLYAGVVASLIPAWIPVRMPLAWFTGAAMIAAALAIASGVQAKLAARLTGLMFVIWFLILHLPRVFHTPRNENEWTSAFVALAVGGGALVLAELRIAKATPA